VRAKPSVQFEIRHGADRVRVGGLSDTVHDYDVSDPESTGLVFREYQPAALQNAVDRGLSVFGDQERWRALQAAGTRCDNSWHRSAPEYVRIYERAIWARPTGAR